MQTKPNSQTEAPASIDYWQVIKNRYGVILLTFLLVFMTAAVITSVIPRKYESSSVVQVHPSMLAIAPTRGGAQQHSGTFMTRNYMENEFQTITASQTLTEAAEALDLPSRWDMDLDRTVKILTQIVNANPTRGTDFIEIAVRHANAEDAKDISKAITNAYIARRNRTEMSRAEKALEALDTELQTHGDVVNDKQKALTVLIQQYGIPYFDGRSSSPVGQTEEIMYQNAQQRLDQLEQDRDRLKIQIDKLVKTSPEELIPTAAGLELPENQVSVLYNQYQEATREIDTSTAQGLGPNHPTVVSLRKRASNLMRDAGSAVASLKDVLNTRINLVDRQVERMKETVLNKKDITVDLSMRQHEYNSAKEEYEQSRDLLREMKIQQQEQRVLLRMPRTPITLHEYPKLEKNPVFPNVTMNLVLGAGVGLIFGIGIAFLLEHLDTSVKSLEDVERYLQVPVLAVIPKDVGVLHKQSGMSPDAEAYRILRTNIEFNRKNPEDNSITVVSGGAGEGKSTTLVNLAYVCAQGGYTTLMIDADLRRPRLHTFFDINNSVGLTNYLTTDLALEDVILQTPVDNLYFLPSGILPADAAGILNSRRMSELLQDVKQRFDLVLVDSPPILGVSDAAVLASEVDLTMVVVQHRKLPRNMLLRVKQAVENVGGQVIGVVLNNVDVRSDSQYQYYTSYYTYYAPSAMDENTAPATSAPVAQSSDSSGGRAAGKEDLY
ncbi:polysaccharide biosynthesis tyrosine autokinase [Akkermansiaceae bacterium]|nr:polysaccharide biosynthesis tyrosine autokinase [Akkermansiaceae bacterium]